MRIFQQAMTAYWIALFVLNTIMVAENVMTDGPYGAFFCFGFGMFGSVFFIIDNIRRGVLR